MQVWYKQKSRFWYSWLSKIARRAKCQKHSPTTKLSIWQSATHHWLSIDCCTCELRSEKSSYRRPCSVDHSRRRTIECLFCDGLQHGPMCRREENRKEFNSTHGISEAETNNKRLRSTFCIEAILTRSTARLLCDSRASCRLCVTT